MAFSNGEEISRDEDLRTAWPFNTDILADFPYWQDYHEDYILGYSSCCSLAYDPTPSRINVQ